MSAATNLSKLDDEDSMRACVTVLALLSANQRGRAKFVERKSALVSLFDLLRSKDQGTQVICGKVSMTSCFGERAGVGGEKLLDAGVQNKISPRGIGCGVLGRLCPGKME